MFRRNERDVVRNVKAWARYTKGRRQLIRLMEEISEPAITTVRDAFAEHPDRCPDQQVAHLVRRGDQCPSGRESGSSACGMCGGSAGASAS